MKQYLIELQDEEYQVIDEDELKQIEESAEKFDGFTGIRIVTELPIKDISLPDVEKKSEKYVNKLVDKKKDSILWNNYYIVFIDSYMQAVNDISESKNLIQQVNQSLPIDYIDAEMVKRWYSKLTGVGEEEMRRDIEAMLRAYKLDRNLNWD